MKAARYSACGPPSVLRLVTDEPVPCRKRGECLVRVETAAVNRLKVKARGWVGSHVGPLPFCSFEPQERWNLSLGSSTCIRAWVQCAGSGPAPPTLPLPLKAQSCPTRAGAPCRG